MRFLDTTFTGALATLLLAVPALAQGTPGGDAIDCGACCGERPAFDDPAYAAFGPGPVAVATGIRLNPADFVVHVIDLSGQGSAPLNTNWAAAPFYHHPSWTAGNLGSVFGVALDDGGNIFVAHGSMFGDPTSPTLDALGFGGAGAIYRINGVTGLPTLFATVPNFQDLSVTPASESWPGIGNISWDCARDQLYATNFEDGRIYRFDALGTCLSTFDHATGTLGTCTPEVGDLPGWAPLGERIWAVEPCGDRLYYGTWSQSYGGGAAPNEVWSVALNGSGNFIAGSEQLEITLPPYSGSLSQPVADIAFKPDGCMLISERTMANNTQSAAHASRLLEYCVDASGAWAPSSNTFKVGAPGWLENSTAGGVDVDFGVGGRVWASGDALQFGPQYVYGLQGLPINGGTSSNSILIDIDQDVSGEDKYEVGSVEVNCPEAAEEPCLTVVDEHLECDPATGDILLTLTITNNSFADAYWALVPPSANSPAGVTLSPNAFPLPPLPNDNVTTATIQLTISGATGDDPVCFTLALATEDLETCCSMEICVDVPDCDCFQIVKESFDNIECLSDGTVTFDWTFTFQNLTPDVLEWLYFLPPAGFSPSVIDLPSVPPNGTHTVTTTVSGVLPGEEVCVTFSIHDQNLNQCCADEVCFEAPGCPDGGACEFCGSPCVNVNNAQECLALGGIYCGDGTDCATDSCVDNTLGACCRDLGNCFEGPACECELVGGTFFPGQSCDEIDCDPPGGACEFCDGTCIQAANENECLAIGGVYCGSSTSCTPPPGCINAIFGACCLPDGTCANQISLCECEFAGGIFSANTSCQQAMCPRGACDMCDGTCVDVFSEPECDSLGGLYCGNGTSCASSAGCAATIIGACCIAGGCYEGQFCECQADSGTFFPGLSCQEACAPATCPGDCDGNGAVDVSDLVMVITSWGPCSGPCAEDMDDDGAVDVDDLLEIILRWGPC